MSQVTRTIMRTNIQRIMDSVGSSRWNTTAGASGEMDRAAGTIFLKEWKRILNVNRHYRMNKIQPTTDVNGHILVSALSTGVTDTKRNFYRILQLSINNYPYKEGTQEEWALGQAQGVAPRVYFRSDTGSVPSFMALPVMATYTFSGTGDFIWVNWFPPAIHDLSGDSITIDFPDGYEDIIAYEAAARLLAKGGAEVEATTSFKALAEEMRADMLQDIARDSAKAQRVQYEDNAAAWGGN